MKKLFKKLVPNGVSLALSSALVLSLGVAPVLAVAAANSIDSAAIIDGQVKTVDLAQKSVGPGKLMDAAVGPTKIAAGAVTTEKVKNDAVTGAKIAAGAVSNADIAAAAAISASKINRTGLDADKLDGMNSSDFVGKTGSQSVSGTLTASAFGYATPKTGYVSVVAAAGQARGGQAATIESGAIYPTSAYTYFEAPVSLPHGAVIKSFTYHYNDTTPDYNSNSWLVKRTNAGFEDSDVMADVMSSGSAGLGSGTGTSILSATVDNVANAYYIVFSLPGGPTLKAAKFTIEYEYTTAGD